MISCSNCQEKIGVFDSLSDFSGNRFCDNKCKKEFQEKKKEEKRLDEEMKAKGNVKEFKRKCNKCGKVWYSLASREKELETGKKVAGGIRPVCCCNSSTPLLAQKNVEGFQDSLEKLKKCPECQSTDYTETEEIHAKK